MIEFTPVDEENLPSEPNNGDFFILGTGSFSRVGIGTSVPTEELEVVGDVKISGIVTATQFVGLVTTAQQSLYSSLSGVSTYSGVSGIATYSTSSGIATYAGTSGISTVAQGLTGTPNIIVGIVTAATYVSSGSTVVYAGINSSFIDSDSISSHYVSFDTTNTSVNVSNFTSGKEVKIIARNTSGSGRNLIFRTGVNETNHSPVPTIVNSSGTVTNGTINVSSNSGIVLTLVNINGTIVGGY
jgi:hypothetical protein